MDIADLLRKKLEHENKARILKGSDAAKTDVVRIQVEGDMKSGKSWFAMSVVKHLYKVMGLSAEQILVCVMDWDMGGTQAHIRKLPDGSKGTPNLQDRILYAQPNHILDAYDVYDAFENALWEHYLRTGVKGFVIVENMGQMWEVTQDFYCKAIYGKPLRERLIEIRRKEVISKARGGKKKIPIFENQRDSYAVINPLHNELRNRILSGRWNTIITTHLKDVYGNRADRTEGKVVSQRGDGQKKNHAFVDYIIRRYRLREFRLSDITDSRDIEKRIVKIKNLDFTKLFELVYAQAKKEGNKGFAKDKFWLTKLTPEPPDPDALAALEKAMVDAESKSNESAEWLGEKEDTEPEEPDEEEEVDTEDEEDEDDDSDDEEEDYFG